MGVTMWCVSTPAISGFATLPPREASGVVRKHPELGGADAPGQVVLAVTARDPAEAAELADLVTAARQALVSQRGSMREVLRALLPQERLTVSPALLLQIQRNAYAQGALADEFGLLSGADVAARAGSRAGNAAALASRWRKEGRAFAVDVDGSVRYPGFQFDEGGRPRPAVAAVLAVAGERMSGWELALWFTGSSDWLGGLRPVDVLDTDADQVVEAAQRLADEILA